jgi:hypothetical protein
LNKRLLGITAGIAAVVGLSAGLGALPPVQMASAQTAATTYTANLAPVPLNGQTGASGTYTIKLDGNSATITGTVSGLAATFMNAPFPHVQHIHGGAQGVCPTASADTNGDGVVNTAEGQPAYGGILTTLSLSGDTTPAAGTNIQIAPSGASFNYSRTIMLDAASVDSLKAGTAVIVVHGLDPAKAAPAATSSPSELVPSLPLAATSPALCGKLTASAGNPGATATMLPPNTGNTSLVNDGNGAPWAALSAGALLAILGLGGVAAVAVRQSR